ncbi:OLC1v1022232C1 [Oldenlandia corymbosa var. corymbosa]|uniref:OLC1v1022232C1 n=1 Tax=Oldenlandia corymbosa var. corymbosa TaxID=529605 RepID=A0AAV1BZN4_OLDCO|nr:OLC1v1022232C1 [Oldenlandia corymbosa var. corymbosa]
MSMQSSSNSGGETGRSSAGAPDFYLPDEILSVIPTDPYEQLDLARKITSMAIASRVTKLESESGRLRQKLYEKDRVVVELEDKVAHLQQAFQEAELRLKITLDENMKLTKERDSLALTAKKLSRDLAKLETFKRQLMMSLNDDTSSQAETVDIVTYDHSVPKAYAVKDEEANGYTSQHSFSTKTESAAGIADDATKQTGTKFSLTPYLSPRLTPTATPKVASANVSPGRYSAAVSPQKTSGATSPVKSQYDFRGGSLSSWYPSSQRSSAANSPPRGRPLQGRTPRIDGKEFFRQARSRLSYEQFSAFLANIKELNAQKQSREETLRKAEEIFGMDNKDLYLSFQGLLNRNMQ